MSSSFAFFGDASCSFDKAKGLTLFSSTCSICSFLKYSKMTGLTHSNGFVSARRTAWDVSRGGGSEMGCDGERLDPDIGWWDQHSSRLGAAECAAGQRKE